MKSFVKVFAVTVLVNYLLVSFFSWDFASLAKCEAIFRIIFFFSSLIIGGMFQAILLDEENAKKDKSFHSRR